MLPRAALFSLSTVNLKLGNYLNIRRSREYLKRANDWKHPITDSFLSFFFPT